MLSCLKAAIPALDKLVLLNNGCSKECMDMCFDFLEKINNSHRFGFVYFEDKFEKNFSNLRNKCFQGSCEGDLILKLDADDVHYAEGIKSCFDIMEKDFSIGRVFAKFLHHRRDPFQHGGVHVKDIFFRQGANTHWQSGVHEGLSGLIGRDERTDYLYHHFGYCKSRSELLSHWINYDILEHGKITAYDVSAYDKVDPNKDLHGQFSPKHNVKYEGPWPQEVNWFFDGTLDKHGLKWTETGLEGGSFDPLKEYIKG